MSRILIVICMLFLGKFSFAQKPTFLKVCTTIEGNEISGMKGFFPHTDTSYIGFFIVDEGINRLAPYYVIFDLYGNLIEEKKISINYPYSLYLFNQVIKTSDTGYIIRGDVESYGTYTHLIKFSNDMSEEWRIFDEVGSSGRLDSLPEYLEIKDGIIYGVRSDISPLSQISILNASNGEMELLYDLKTKCNDFTDSSSVSSILKTDSGLFLNTFTRNSSGGNYTFYNNFIPDSANQCSSFTTSSKTNHLGFYYPYSTGVMSILDSSKNQYFSDLYTYDGSFIGQIQAPIPDGKFEPFRYFNYPNREKLFCRIQKQGLGHSNFEYFLIEANGQGALTSKNFNIKFNSDSTISNWIAYLNVLEEGIAFYMNPYPGVPRTPKYLVLADSNLNVNGVPFQNYFVDNASSIQSIQETSEISVFPNPTSTQFTIQTNSKKPIQYSLYSLNGKLVGTGNFVSQTQIDISEFTEGVYLLHLQSDEGVEVKKLVVR